MSYISLRTTFVSTLTFALAACSSGSSEKPGEAADVAALRQTKIQNQAKIDQLTQQVTELENKLAAAQTNTQTDNASQNSTDSGNKIDNSSSPQEDEAAKAAAIEARVKQYASSYFADKPDSYTYKAFASEATQADLIAQAKKADAFAGNCSGARSACASSAEAGKVLQSKQLSYAGYGVIRETYGLADQGVPTNAFFYYVDTPTTDKALVVNATYTGQAHYSRQNGPNVMATTDPLVMNVVDGQISGKVTKTSGSGVVSDVISFDKAEIVAEQNRVSFNGSATFHSSSFGNKGDISGSYQGQFAGANAQEVVGTFESQNSAKESSVQGAFSATK